MGALKTSEQADAVAGEGLKDPSADDRPVDSGAKIIIGPEGIAPPLARPVPPGPAARPAVAVGTAPGRPEAPRAPAPLPPRTVAEPPRRSGLGLVIVMYVLSAAALAYAIYERFLA